jgi:2-keto-4-pentenoate hydratase/2-oxohepta-3-ene-1,7-dioic acid hydratase in catechol pathway
VEGLPSRRIDRIPLAQASLLPPVEPSKIVCVGRNYREHAAELGNDVPQEPLYFSSRLLRCCRQAEPFFGPKFPSAPITRANWES